MYPSIELFGIEIFTFGFLMVWTWVLFFVLLHRFSAEKNIIRPIFAHIVPFTISILFFARLFHIFDDWVDEKFIFESLVTGHFFEFLKLFFTPPQYLFSLFGGILGFFLVFFIKTRKMPKNDQMKYLEVAVYSFLGASLLGFFAALLGGQVYGIPSSSIFSLRYTDNPIIKDAVPLFPLPIVYLIGVTAILFFMKNFRKKHVLPEGFLGLIGIGLFSLLLFFGEFLSGEKTDMFYDLVLSLTGGLFGLSLNQIGAFLGISITLIGIMKTTDRNIS